MQKKLIGEWKKAFESDLPYIAQEMKGLLEVPAAIIVEGEMGSGKTTFCKAFSNDSKTTSPTYSVLTQTDDMLHADFYRLEEVEEITHLELEHYLEEKKFAFFEWGEKFLSAIIRELPENFTFYLLQIQVNDPHRQSFDNAHSRNFSLRVYKDLL